jgi:hypothetical protein
MMTASRPKGSWPRLSQASPAHGVRGRRKKQLGVLSLDQEAGPG